MPSSHALWFSMGFDQTPRLITHTNLNFRLRVPSVQLLSHLPIRKWKELDFLSAVPEKKESRRVKFSLPKQTRGSAEQSRAQAYLNTTSTKANLRLTASAEAGHFLYYLPHHLSPNINYETQKEETHFKEVRPVSET